MKAFAFIKCDTCIGITPCSFTKTGELICDYCKQKINSKPMAEMYPIEKPQYRTNRI